MLPLSSALPRVAGVYYEPAQTRPLADGSVAAYPRHRPWVARIRVDGKLRRLGRFATEAEAAAAVEAARAASLAAALAHRPEWARAQALARL